MSKENNFKLMIAQYVSGRTANTERRYAHCVNAFSHFLKRDLSKATPTDAINFLSSLRRRGMSDRTIRNTYSALRVLYEFAVELGLIKRNPFAVAKRVISMRQIRDVRPTQFIEFGRIPEIMASIHPADHESLGSQKSAIRDRAILAVFFGCGLRRSEVSALTVGSVHVEPPVAHVAIAHGKSGKGRRVALSPWAMEFLTPLVSQRKSDGADDADPLFAFYYASGAPRGALCDRTIARIYRAYVGAAPHSARKTYGTLLSRMGASAAQIARDLGHANTSQVHVYEEPLRLEDSPARNIRFGKKGLAGGLHIV